MKKVALVVVLLVAVAFVGSALATAPGKTVDFENSLGTVTFDGKTHADAGNKCTDCHTKIFQMKKGAFEMKAPHTPGEYCGACHNGTDGFAQEGNCAKCHKK